MSDNGNCFEVRCMPSNSLGDPLLPEWLRALIKKQNGKDCKRESDLPYKLCFFALVELVDVSALGGVKELNLSGCTQVVDVSALGGVRDTSHCRVYRNQGPPMDQYVFLVKKTIFLCIKFRLPS